MTDMCAETFLGADAYVEEFSHLNCRDNTIELINFLFNFFFNLKTVNCLQTDPFTGRTAL